MIGKIEVLTREFEIRRKKKKLEIIEIKKYIQNKISLNGSKEE